jgi:lipopolysaccharide transport system ATP-binding protein
MSSEIAVRFNDVSKRYRLRSGRAGLLELVQRSRGNYHEALHDISFEIAAGQATALLGPNGAGKSTLLRLLAGISRPTSGTIETSGQVGALMEVWSGVHQELTGRENIRMYGRILGLSRRQIAERYDAIVEFAELDDVLDQQVKYYSSGMQLRLGFSIAAHVEPQILVIDEALSVGDARFQRRCVTRMRELMRTGTTLIYVSHDLKSVEAICDQGLLLEQGRLTAVGSCREVLQLYIDQTADPAQSLGRLDQSRNLVKLEGIGLHNQDGHPAVALAGGAGAELELCFSGPAKLESPHVVVGISQGGPTPLAVCSMAEHDAAPTVVGARWSCRLTIDELPLRSGNYELWLGVLGDDALSELFEWAHVLTFKVATTPGKGRRGVTEDGPIMVAHRFEVEA